MTTGKKGGPPAGAGDLRERAEARLALSDPAPGPGELAGEDPGKLVHELRTHQVELELQNEELRAAQLALTEAHDRYLDL